MPFSEKLKLEVKRKAAFRCCRCQSISVQIHHILPEAHSGDDTIDNAAPLCANCHSSFGDNPVKRKEITEMRDWWYEQVENRFYGPSPAQDVLEQINTKLEDIQANQSGVNELKDLLRGITDEMISQITPATADIAASSIVNASTASSAVELGPRVYGNFVCPQCGTRVGLLIGSNACPTCGHKIQ